MTKLQKLDPQNIPHLLEELKKYLPDSIVAYFFVLNHIKWSEKDAGLNFSILCPNGDWRGASLVLLIDGLAAPNKIYGTIYALEENLEVLGNCLLETDLIDWTRVVKLTAIPVRCVPAVKTVMIAKGYTDIINFSEVCQLNYVPMDEIKKTVIPRYSENLKVAPLTLANLDTLCDNWKYYQPEIRAVVVKMIESNTSFGIFLNDPEKGEETLAAMVLQSEYGGIGLLSTLPEHRRKGFAALALSHLIQEMGQKGLTPFSLNATENQASSRIFAKFGFKKGGLYQWIKPVKIIK